MAKQKLTPLLSVLNIILDSPIEINIYSGFFGKVCYNVRCICRNGAYRQSKRSYMILWHF